MCGTILWVGKQDDSTTLKSINSMHWWPSFQRRRIEIRRRILKRMLSICSEMLTFGTYWKTRYSMVSEQTCTIDHKMDHSLWQTIISFDLLHPSHMWIQTGSSCWKHSTTMQTWIVSRLWFRGRSRRLKINIRRSSVHFRKSHYCTDQLDVQETDFCFTQFYRSWNNFSRCRFTLGWYHRTWFMGFGDWSISSLTKPNQESQRSWLLPRTSTNMRNQNPTKHINLDLANIDHVSSNVKHCGSRAVLYVFEDNEAVIKMIMKGRSPTMRHVSRTHRVAPDWLFDWINLHPKLQFRYIDSKHQLADMLT